VNVCVFYANYEILICGVSFSCSSFLNLPSFILSYQTLSFKNIYMIDLYINSMNE
jgi:hypothetical protein